MTKFEQRQSEECFKMARFSERHTMPIGSIFRVAYVSERHATHTERNHILRVQTILHPEVQ